jgi:hypothetical protein
VSGTVRDRDYPGSCPRGGGSLQLTIMAQCVQITMMVLVAMRSSVRLKGSSTPAYKGPWRGHHDGSGTDTT